MITQAELKAVVTYDPATGVFTNLAYRSANCRAGQVLQGVHSKGYVRITVNGRRYFAHRLAWLYVYGVWPSKEIDHKDRNKKNNRILNLRDATDAENSANIIAANKNSKTQVRGVHKHGTMNKFVAQRRIGGRTVHLGVFDTVEEAAAAREAKR